MTECAPCVWYSYIDKKSELQGSDSRPTICYHRNTGMKVVHTGL